LGADPETLAGRASTSFEDALWRTLIYRDIFGPFRRIVASSGDDRGLALERVWQSTMQSEHSFSAFQDDALQGRRPGVILTTAHVTSAEPVQISTAGQMRRRADFRRHYGPHDLSMVTAARLSALFPIVVPLPVDSLGISSNRLIDGGVGDLFGVDGAVSWLAEALPGQTRVRRVLLLQIEVPQLEPHSAFFANRVYEQRRRNRMAVENLQRSLGPGFQFREVQLALKDDPSVAWHLTTRQRDRIASEWNTQAAGPAVASIVEFLR
jgi:hypothetical protein